LSFSIENDTNDIYCFSGADLFGALATIAKLLWKFTTLILIICTYRRAVWWGVSVIGTSWRSRAALLETE